MKALSFILIICSLHAYSQVDSSKIKIDRVYDEVFLMKQNLQKCDKQYDIGVRISISSLFVIIGGFIAPEHLQPYILSVGGAMALTGSIFMIDSHKYIGSAGRFRFSSNSVSLNLN